LDLAALIRDVAGTSKACYYNQALQKLVLQYLTPAESVYEDRTRRGTGENRFGGGEEGLSSTAAAIRCGWQRIILKPFVPKSAETIYRSFNLREPWEDVGSRYAAAGELTGDCASSPNLTQAR